MHFYYLIGFLGRGVYIDVPRRGGLGERPSFSQIEFAVFDAPHSASLG